MSMWFSKNLTKIFWKTYYDDDDAVLECIHPCYAGEVTYTAVVGYANRCSYLLTYGPVQCGHCTALGIWTEYWLAAVVCARV